MASKKTLEERISEKNEQLQKALVTAKQYEAQVKQLERRRKEEERKKRTRRLIEIGGSVESVLGRAFEEGDIIRLMNFLKDQNERGNYFTLAMEKPIIEKTEATDNTSPETMTRPRTIQEKLQEMQERSLLNENSPTKHSSDEDE